MPTFAEEMAETGRELIDEFGEPFVFTTYASYTKDGPRTTPVGPPTPREIVVGVEPWDSEGTEFVRNGQMVIWVLAEDTTDFEVEEGLVVTRELDDTHWTVGEVGEYAVQGVRLAWVLQISSRRKATVAP